MATLRFFRSPVVHGAVSNGFCLRVDRAIVLACVIILTGCPLISRRDCAQNVLEKGTVPPAETLSDGRPQPLELLARRLASETTMPGEFVERTLSKWVKKGLIVCRQDETGHRWSWRESNTARSPLRKSPPLP